MRNKIQSVILVSNETTVVDSGPGLETLYPILGLYAILVSIGYLIFAVEDYIKNTEIIETYKKSTKKEKSASNTYFIISIMLAFLFLHCGVALMYATYLATFTVESQLQLSRQTGARMTAVFWGSFAAMRFVAIFLYVKLGPLGTLLLSFFIIAVGGTILAIFGENSVDILSICTAFMGIGSAPIYASCMLWMDEFITVTNRIGSFTIVAAKIGSETFPLLLGQFIDNFPMLLMYVQVGVVYACILLFTLAAWAVK